MSSFLRDIPEEQLDEIAAYLDQGPSYESVVDRDGTDSLSDEYWRRLIKRLAKVDKKHVNLLDKSYIRDLEKEAWELKSPSKKLLETLKNPNRGLELDLFRSCLGHKDVNCRDALKVLKEGTQSPIIVTEPEDCEVEAGGQLKLVCKVECSYSRPQYQWFNELQALPNSNTDTYQVPKVHESHAGQYTCRVRNPCIADPKRAFVFSRTVQVTVTPPPAAPIQETSPLPVPPAITTQPQSLNVQCGSEAVLSCRADGPPDQMVTYQWYKGGKPLPSDTSGDLRIPQVTCEDEGKYNCVVSCGEAKAYSKYVDISVKLETSPLPVMVTSPLAITTQPQSLNVQWGSEAMLSCRAKGPPGQMVTYQWYKGGKLLPSENSGYVRIPQVTCEDEGKYYCVVSCGEAKTYSECVDINVQLEEADYIEITRHPEDVQVRVNDTIILSCEAKNKAGRELMYEWFKGDKKVGCGPSCQFKAGRHGNYIKCDCRVSLKVKDKVFIKSKQATITVVSLCFTIQPQNVNGYVGERVILWCHAENITSPAEDITYDWLKSVNKEGPFKMCFGSGEVLVIESLTDKHPGYYKCQANGGLITSDTVYVGAKLPGNTDDIKLPVICITKQPCGWAIEPNKSFSLICKATASKGDVTYQWYKDGRFLPNEQKSELKRMSAKLSDFGSYYCLVRTVEGGAVALSDTARVEIKPEELHYAQEKVALLIGNGHYKKMPELKNVECDIRNLQGALTSLRFKVISLLDLTYDEMIKALGHFYGFLKAGVYAVFYFSGHGFSCNDITYLMPIDAARDPLKCDSNISAKNIKYNMQETPATGLSLLDCCAVCTDNIQPPRNTTSQFVKSQNLYEISACLEGHFAYMHTFNDALVECINKKNRFRFHELCPEIQEIMKNDKDHPQLPTMSGGVLHKDITLHDPIMFESEDAMKHSDLLWDQANSVPEAAVLNVDLGHPTSLFQLCLKFSAEFRNILNVTVEVCPLPSNCHISFSVDENFLCSQGVDICYSTSSKFKIKGIQRVKDPLKLCLAVTVTQDSTTKTVKVIHEFKSKVLFGSLV